MGTYQDDVPRELTRANPRMDLPMLSLHRSDLRPRPRSQRRWWAALATVTAGLMVFGTFGCAKKQGICEAHYKNLESQGEVCIDMTYATSCSDHMTLGALGPLTTYSNPRFTPDAFCKERGYAAGNSPLISFKDRKRAF
jgi:hypothetical protein